MTYIVTAKIDRDAAFRFAIELVPRSAGDACKTLELQKGRQVPDELTKTCGAVCTYAHRMLGPEPWFKGKRWPFVCRCEHCSYPVSGSPFLNAHADSRACVAGRGKAWHKKPGRRRARPGSLGVVWWRGRAPTLGGKTEEPSSRSSASPSNTPSNIPSNMSSNTALPTLLAWPVPLSHDMNAILKRSRSVV